MVDIQRVGWGRDIKDWFSWDPSSTNIAKQSGNNRLVAQNSGILKEQIKETKEFFMEGGRKNCTLASSCHLNDVNNNRVYR